ncbi:hypothetical protein CANCADRAFT_259 [Tortispora caseinolytica NRRL Y-17796]|uniref:Major facilitator superfamily (MFS) profile domain-containing protein n=1 Tax=Tortispora caseinolytica NRRL Y-17796 TaxID=767744 RepID=A0A1E4TIZ3_9ASCO|nr:hypothetical protein CANCADRAFT_259 [Tortispora caseinolytica NRRL Y-17796]
MAILKSCNRGTKLYHECVIASSLMFLFYGYDAGLFGGILGQDQFLRVMGYPQDPWTIPLMSSCYTIAAFATVIPVIVFGLKIGRKRLLIIGSVLTIIGGTVQASSYGQGQMFAGRVIAGLGVGLISDTAPPYLAEQAIRKDTRGVNGMIMGCILIGGIPIAYWLCYGLGFPCAFQNAFALVALFMIWRLPDTPRWYYATDRIEQGDDTLAALFDLPIDHPDVMEVKNDILNAIALEHEAESSIRFKDFFWDKTETKSAWRTLLPFIIMSSQQLLGTNFAVYFATVIFSNVGLDDNLSALLAAVLNTIFWLGTIPTIFLSDKFGRRNIMLYGTTGCCLMLAVFIGCIGRDHPTTTQQWVGIGFLLVYMLILGFAWMEYRHAGAAMAAGGEWLFSFVTVFCSPIALADPSVGWKIWLWFLVCSAVIIPFIYFCIPETSNKTLEEIDLMYVHKVPAWRSKSVHFNFTDNDRSNRADLGEKAFAEEREIA